MVAGPARLFVRSVTVGQDGGKLCCSCDFREHNDNRKHAKQRRWHALCPLHNVAGCYTPGVALRASVDRRLDHEHAACAAAVVVADLWKSLVHGHPLMRITLPIQSLRLHCSSVFLVALEVSVMSCL